MFPSEPAGETIVASRKTPMRHTDKNVWSWMNYMSKERAKLVETSPSDEREGHMRTQSAMIASASSYTDVGNAKTGNKTFTACPQVVLSDISPKRSSNFECREERTQFTNGRKSRF